jgi:hypothetical protein
VKSFEDTNGNSIADIPERYRVPQGRITRVNSWSANSLYKNASFVTWGASGLILVLLFGLVWLIRLAAWPVVKRAAASQTKARINIK